MATGTLMDLLIHHHLALLIACFVTPKPRNFEEVSSERKHLNNTHLPYIYTPCNIDESSTTQNTANVMHGDINILAPQIDSKCRIGFGAIYVGSHNGPYLAYLKWSSTAALEMDSMCTVCVP
jgi:hypothetical protein